MYHKPEQTWKTEGAGLDENKTQHPSLLQCYTVTNPWKYSNKKRCSLEVALHVRWLGNDTGNDTSVRRPFRAGRAPPAIDERRATVGDVGDGAMARIKRRCKLQTTSPQRRVSEHSLHVGQFFLIYETLRAVMGGEKVHRKY